LVDYLWVSTVDGSDSHRSTTSSRRRRRLLAQLLAGGLLFVAGGAGLDVAQSRIQRLSAHGVHTTATVEEADTHKKGFRFDTRLIVAFAAEQGRSVRTRVWIGDTDYFVGQRVPVVYDPAAPTNAQLDGDDAGIGPIRLPLVVAEIVGAALLVYALGGALFSLVRRRLP
jgi:hypothetical protein